MKSKKVLNMPIYCVRIFLLILMLVVTGVSYAESNPSIKESLQSKLTNDISSTSELPPVKIASNNKGRQKLQGISLGVYQTREEINEIVTKLRQLGFETKIRRLKQGYIVSAGVFSSKSNVERALNRLQQAGFGDKVRVINVDKKQGKAIALVKAKKLRSTVFKPNVSSTQSQNLLDEYVPKKDYVKLKQEVGTLKSQMQLLLEKLALTEQDLNPEQRLNEQQKTKEKKLGSQTLEKAPQTKENKPVSVKPKKNKQIEGDDEITREDEAKEAKRGLDTFLRGKKVLYKPGEFEIEFDLAYGQDTAVNTFGFSPATNRSRSNAKLTSRSVDSSIIMRYGVVDDLMFTLTVPYGFFEQEADNQPFNEVLDDEGNIDETKTTAPVSHTNAVGVGDIGGSFSYNVFSESGNIPTVTLSLSGQVPTGNYNRGLGTGFWGVGGGVSLVKTIDPVVFFGSLGYSAAFEERGIAPSDQVSYSIGAGYSMNDRVSFSTSLSGRLAGRTEVKGIDRPGSSIDAHSLQINTTIQLTKGFFVEPFVDFGLTKDASDFAFGLRFPYRFGEKFPLPFSSD